MTFFTDTLGFQLVRDTPMGDAPGGPRWIEVAPTDRPAETLASLVFAAVHNRREPGGGGRALLLHSQRSPTGEPAGRLAVGRRSVISMDPTVHPAWDTEESGRRLPGRRSSEVEQAAHNRCVGGSSPPAATGARAVSA
jgi:catechol 2,3-dioxygenase-like lactoylglutathione lyase family enzyme